MMRALVGAAILTLRSCAPIAGAASCDPDGIGSEEGVRVSLGAGAVLALTFEAFAPDWGGTGGSISEALVAVDTPYPLAESDLSDNQLLIRLDLASFADGFEP
jgi:hypothetical protein